eukprot:69425_1
MYRKYYQKQYFIQRNNVLLTSLSISLTLLVYGHILPSMLYLTFNINYFGNHDDNIAFTVILVDIFLYPAFTLVAVRYFDLMIKIIYSQQTKHWRLLLNPTDTTNNFILKHYNMLSRPKYQIITAFTLCAIITTLAVTATCLGTQFYMIRVYTLALLWISLAIFIGICLYKIGKFADFWYIRQELWVLCGVICVIVIIFVVSGIIGDDVQNDTTLLFVILMTEATLCILWICIMILGPIYFNERRDKKIKKNTKKSGNETKQQLFDLMQDKNGYEALMDHLEQEFAVENILYLSEMIQFRDYLNEKHNGFFNDPNVNRIFENKSIFLPKDVPKSPIIYPNTGQVNVMVQLDDTAHSEMKKIQSVDFDVGTIDDTERIFVLLYKKYIDKYNADLEINISYSIHNTLKNYYGFVSKKLNQTLNESDNIDQIDFVMIWNHLVLAAREVTSILHHSANRCSYKI